MHRRVRCDIDTDGGGRGERELLQELISGQLKLFFAFFFTTPCMCHMQASWMRYVPLPLSLLLQPKIHTLLLFMVLIRYDDVNCIFFTLPHPLITQHNEFFVTTFFPMYIYYASSIEIASVFSRRPLLLHSKHFVRTR